MFNEVEELNEYFMYLGWEVDYKLSSNTSNTHLYKKNNDYFRISFNKYENINISVPININDYKANYNTNFNSLYIAMEYIYNHLNYYEKIYTNINEDYVVNKDDCIME
jgi:hypothetical protein